MSRIKWNLDLLEEVKQQHDEAMAATEQVINSGKADLSSMTEEVWEGEDADMARDQLHDLLSKEMAETWKELDICNEAIQKAQKTAYESKNFCNRFPQIFRSGSMPSESDQGVCNGDLLCDDDSCSSLIDSMLEAGQRALNVKSKVESAESILAELETDVARFDYSSYTDPIKTQTQNVADRTGVYNSAVSRYEQKTQDMDNTFSNELIGATPVMVPEPFDPSCLELGDQIHMKDGDVINFLEDYQGVEIGGKFTEAQLDNILKMLFGKRAIDVASLSEKDFDIALINLPEDKRKAVLMEMGLSAAQIGIILERCDRLKTGSLNGKSIFGKSMYQLLKNNASSFKAKNMDYKTSNASNGNSIAQIKNTQNKQNTGTKTTNNGNQKTPNYESLQTQYGFSDEEMTYLIDNHPELLSQLYGANAHSTSDAEKIYNNIVAELCEYHVSQLKNKDGSLKMDDICAYMNKEPLDITISEYLALCELFDEMDKNSNDNSQKEQFIQAGFKCEKVYTDYSTTGGGSGYYKYTRSETFEMFTKVYCKNFGLSLSEFDVTLRDGESTEEAKKRIEKANHKMDNYNLLYAVTYATDSTFKGGSFSNAAGLGAHDDGDTLKISINEVGDQYKISVKTYHKNKVTPNIETDALSYNKEFTIYKFDFCLGDSFTQASNNAAEGLRIDVDRIATNKVIDFVSKEIFQEGVDAINAAGRIPFLSTGFTLLTLYADIQKEKRQAEHTNGVVDTIQYDNNASKYLNKINCAGSLIVDQDGNAYITSYNYDVEKVKQRIEEYNSMYPDNKVDFNEDTFINDLLTNEEYRNSLDPEGSSTSFFDYWDEQENACSDQNVNTEEG